MRWAPEAVGHQGGAWLPEYIHVLHQLVLRHVYAGGTLPLCFCSGNGVHYQFAVRPAPTASCTAQAGWLGTRACHWKSLCLAGTH